MEGVSAFPETQRVADQKRSATRPSPRAETGGPSTVAILKSQVWPSEAGLRGASHLVPLATIRFRAMLRRQWGAGYIVAKWDLPDPAGEEAHRRGRYGTLGTVLPLQF